MTFAWYGHLEHRAAPLAAAILVSWLIALGEYCFRAGQPHGLRAVTVYQLEIIQDAITLLVFMAFAYLSMGESLRWNNAASLVYLLAAVGFAFWHA